MSLNVVDIPGYYYDLVSRRYYKHDPMNPRPQILAISHENVLPESVEKSSRSVLNLLKRRDTGFGKHSFENAVISSRSSNLHCVESEHSVDEIDKRENVVFLKSGEKTLFVEFTNKQQNRYFLEEKLHCFSPEIKKLFVDNSTLYSIADMVEPNFSRQFILLILTDSNTWNVLLCSKCNSFSKLICKNRAPIWCLAKNDFSCRVALGEKNNVVLSTINSDHIYSGENKIPVQGEVRSAHFNKQGNMLFTGRHTGHIGSMDLRAKDSVFYEKLHRVGIDETVLLSNENYLICGAFDGMLCKVDLRMIKPVCEYLGHVKTPRKLPFSICEPNHLLCATGTDNVTRLWNLSGGGEPITRIKPRISGATCRSCLVSNGHKFCIYQFQKHFTYTYHNNMLGSIST